MKGHYAFKEETAMVEFGYQPKDEYVPLGKVISLPACPVSGHLFLQCLAVH